MCEGVIYPGPDSSITEQLRKSLSYAYSNSLNASDSRMTSQLVPMQDDAPAWKEDFMMTSAFDVNRMNHVSPLQSTPYTSEFKIIDDQVYHSNAVQFEDI